MDNKPVISKEGKAKWESRLLNDLVYIKKHGRYPLNKRTILPVGGIFLFILLTLRFAWPVLVLGKDSALVPYMMLGVGLLAICSVILRYINVLKFSRLTTPLHVQANIALLTDFFKEQHLAYTQHPEAPEVFMILSRPLGGNDDNREVMIFIADNKQILVNSHFTNQKFTVSPPSKQYKHMAARLHKWINEYIDNSNSTGSSLQKN